MIIDILIMIGLTLLPFFELRASIPYGIFNTSIHWSLVFLICVVSNILLSFFVWVFVNYFMHLFLRIKFIEKIYHKVVERTQKKISPYVHKYGPIGLALFIGVPLPGSGVYAGGLGAYLLGFKFKEYITAAIIGTLIAGVAVLLISMFGNGALLMLIKH